MLSRLPDIGKRLLEINEELLKVMKKEIMDCDELRQKAGEQGIKGYYMMLERKHLYEHPVYENGVNTLFNQLIRTERDRLNTPSKQPIREPPLTLAQLIESVLSTKEMGYKQTFNKGDQYIYKVFPNAEQRLKAVCNCINFLYTGFNKFIEDKEWNKWLTDDMKKTLKEQLQKYFIVTFRFLQREEKCLYKNARKCLETLYKKQKDNDEIFSEQILDACIEYTFKKQSILSLEYRKIMRIIKIFPHKVDSSFWNKLRESSMAIIKKLKEDNSQRNERSRLSSGFNAACFLINCHKYELGATNFETFKYLLEQVTELQKLITQCGTQYRVFKNALANFFNKYSIQVCLYLETLHDSEQQALRDIAEIEGFTKYDLLKLINTVVKSKKANDLRQSLIECSHIILDLILSKDGPRHESYNTVHELLILLYGLNKVQPLNEKIVHNIAEIWSNYIVISDEIQYLQYDYACVIKLLIGYVINNPNDVKIVYKLLPYVNALDRISANKLKRFFAYEYPKLISLEIYKIHIEYYLKNVNNADATLHLVIPILFYAFKKGIANEFLDELTEDKLITSIYSNDDLKTQGESLKLGALLLEYTPYLNINKQTLIVDLWKKTKAEDIEVKVWAYVGFANLSKKVRIPNERTINVIHNLFGETSVEYRIVLEYATDKYAPTISKEQNLMQLKGSIKHYSAFLGQSANIFGMIGRNSALFKSSRHIFYGNMIKAFQKLFFYTKLYQPKVIALKLATIMILWGMEGTRDRALIETERQIKSIIATCLFKELFQMHYILDTDDCTENEAIELTYKCLAIFRMLLVRYPDVKFAITAEENRSITDINRVSFSHFPIYTLFV